VRVVVLALLIGACQPRAPESSSVTPALTQTTEEEQPDPIAILTGLEALIEQGKDSEDDRLYAYDAVKKLADDGTAAWAFARAATTGRVAELRGAGAGKLVGETESFARLALERDPQFRDGEVTRMLGTLYVKAPPRLVEHGDSEAGLSMLEDLARDKPEDTRNHLRLAEAYLHLGEEEAAADPLCKAFEHREELRLDEQKLLGGLIEETFGSEFVGCMAKEN
jgi:hypothetical protein